MPETFFISLQLHSTHVWALLHQSSRCYDSIRHTRRRFRRRQTGVCKESRKLCAKIKDVRVEHKTGNKSRQREEEAVRSIGGLWKGRHDKRVHLCLWLTAEGRAESHTYVISLACKLFGIRGSWHHCGADKKWHFRGTCLPNNLNYILYIGVNILSHILFDSYVILPGLLCVCVFLETACRFHGPD